MIDDAPLAWRREMRNVQQIAFLNFWDRLRGDKLLPDVASLQPDDLRRLAENLMFCDVAYTKSQRAFVVRYQGSQVQRAFGVNATGLALDDPSMPRVERFSISDYHQVCEKVEPHFRIIRLRHPTGAVVRYKRLLLPFGKRTARVARIVSLIALFSEENGYPDGIVGSGTPL